MLDPIQSLWIGGRLSTLERLSVASFLAHGHPYHLYTYGEVEGVPDGAKVHDAREVLPEDRIFTYQTGAVGKGGYSGFANLWRLHLLHDRGGWWADTDIVCTRPWTGFADEVIATSPEGKWGEPANNCVLKMPAGSPVAAYCIREHDRFDLSTLKMAQNGPHLLQEAIREVGSDGLVAADVFCPYGWQIAQFATWPRWRTAWHNAKRTLRRDGMPRFEPFPPDGRAVHLWTNMWKQNGLDKDVSYPPSSLYERLKRQYLAGASA